MQYVKVFVLIWISVFFIFILGYNAGWNYDAITFSYLLKDRTIDYLIEIPIDFTIRYVYHFLYYLLNHCFGTQGWDWYLFKITLHSINGFLLYYITKDILHQLALTPPKIITILPMLLFLVSPYTTEVVLYQATFHYSLATACNLFAIYCAWHYLSSNTTNYFVLFFLASVLGVFCLEITLMLPLMILIVSFIYHKRITYSSKSLILIATSTGIAGVYILLTYIRIGSPVGHYGTEIHFQPEFQRSVANVFKFFSDVYLYTQYWNFNSRVSWYQFFERNTLTAILLVVVIIILIVRFSSKQKIYTILLLLGLTLISLLPVINLFFLFVTPIEGDRYYYYSLTFLYLLIGVVAAYISPVLSYIIVSYLFIANMIILQKNIIQWRNAQYIIDETLQTISYKPNKRYLFLAVADRYKGCLVFGSDEQLERPFNMSDFAMALCVKNNAHFEDKVGQVINYNTTDIDLSPTITIVNDTTLKYTLPCCGHWWWKRRHGLIDFENNYYKVNVVGGWQQEVIVTFKQKPKDMIYLYQSGTTFKELNF